MQWTESKSNNQKRRGRLSKTKPRESKYRIIIHYRNQDFLSFLYRHTTFSTKEEYEKGSLLWPDSESEAISGFLKDDFSQRLSLRVTGLFSSIENIEFEGDERCR